MNRALDVVRGIAAMLGVSNGRVVLSFCVHPDEDGGPAWSINATRPVGRRVESFHASGPSLEAAAAEFAEMMIRRGVK